jgi:hypothetical protein
MPPMTRPARTTSCPEFHQGHLTRRRLLQVGGLGCLGLSLPNLLRAQDAARQPARRRARAVIFLHQFGGPSHVDSFDMKPNAADGFRGEFRPIPTNLPGVHICEHLPRMARTMDRVTLVRSVQHNMRNHNSATYYSLTGHAPPLDDIRLRDSLDLFPAYGSFVDRLAPARGGMPTFVAYPHVLRDGSITPGQTASFLGRMHNPLLITQNPNDPDFRLPELSLPANLSPDRLENRRQAMRLIDEQTRVLETSPLARGINSYYDRALTMLTSPRLRQAFDLSAEPAMLRDRYGRTTYGQGCLLARRLIEAGARFVNVYFAPNIGGRSTSGGWDTHGFDHSPVFPLLRDYLLPYTDQTLPTLLEDLDLRGLLDETLVVWMGEFGRTPRISNLGGRDHWPQCYSVLLAGGGVRRGFVYGSSDRIGAYPGSDPVRPDDLAATMFSLLGIDPQTEVTDAQGRPLAITRGTPVTGLLS